MGGGVGVASGCVMCVPYRIGKELAARMPLRIRQLPDGAPSYDLILLTHRLFDYQAALQWLIEELKWVSHKFK